MKPCIHHNKHDPNCMNCIMMNDTIFHGTDFTSARIKYIEQRVKDKLPSPTRDELAAFADGWNARLKLS